MRTRRASSGPFAERPYFKLSEIDQICADELEKVGLFPAEPQPIRIDRFIEKRFKVAPQYEDLPDRVLGYTKFGTKGVQEIGISKALVEEDSKVSERRINSTLAHEAGHGLLHAHLFILERPPKDLIGSDFNIPEKKILCRNETVEGIRDRLRIDCGQKWWEYQANMAIGGLLLPMRLVRLAMEPYLVETGQLNVKILTEAAKEKATRVLAEIFDVNPIVVRIRIETLFSRSREDQPLL